MFTASLFEPSQSLTFLSSLLTFFVGSGRFSDLQQMLVSSVNRKKDKNWNELGRSII